MNKKEKLAWYAKEFETIAKTVQDKNKLSYEDFLRIRNFKLQNQSRENPQKVENITEEAFKLAKNEKIEEAIKKLLEIHGVAVPIASTILATKYPKNYCIIDRIVLNTLNKKEWLKNYKSSTKIYKEYLLLMREKAKSQNLPLRELERKLFEA